MPDDLLSRFTARSDDEMLRLGAEYGSLTDEAQAIVRAEVQRRNLDIPTEADGPQRYSLTLREVPATVFPAR